jgi:hypothetical protein
MVKRCALGRPTVLLHCRTRMVECTKCNILLHTDLHTGVVSKPREHFFLFAGLFFSRFEKCIDLNTLTVGTRFKCDGSGPSWLDAFGTR